MKKFKLLLLDANIVIEIASLGLWNKIVERCEISLSRTVIEEAQFYEDNNGDRIPIDLKSWISSNAISVFDQKSSDLAAFRNQFDPVYFEKLDPGETESLVFLLKQTGECQLCSADKIVFRVLGNLKRGEQGISLEEILDKIGLSRKLKEQFTRTFREEWTKRGFREGLGGMGTKGLT